MKKKPKTKIKPSTEEPLNAPDTPTKPINPLDGLDPEELVLLSDVEFQAKVRKHARSKTADAMNVIEDVMHSSEDDQARLLAATKMLKIAKAEEEEKGSFLPSSIPPEVFAIALAGLGKLAGIAQANFPKQSCET